MHRSLVFEHAKRVFILVVVLVVHVHHVRVAVARGYALEQLLALPLALVNDLTVLFLFLLMQPLLLIHLLVDLVNDTRLAEDHLLYLRELALRLQIHSQLLLVFVNQVLQVLLQLQFDLVDDDVIVFFWWFVVLLEDVLEQFFFRWQFFLSHVAALPLIVLLLFL